MAKERTLKFMARRIDWSYGIGLYARQIIEGGGILAAQPMELKKHERSSIYDPFATISIDEAQNIMDELWQCGIRPSEGTGSAGSLKATQDHLSDMQKIAFKNYK